MNGDAQKSPEPPQPQFKGVWICAEIWEHPDLTYAEKFLIAEIDSLSGKGKACFASNEFLANRILQKLSHANNLLASLTTRGFLIRLHFDGRETKRCVHPDISSNPRAAKALLKEYSVSEPALEQPSVKSESSFTESRENPKKQTSPKSETESPNIGTSIETTKTKSGSPSPAKRHVRRGSRDPSSSFSLALPGEGEKEVTKEPSSQSRSVITSTPQSPAAPRVAAITPEKEKALGNGYYPIPKVDTEVDALLAEFGPFNESQRRQIADYFDADPGNVMAKATIVRSEPRANAAKSFMAALRDDWQPKRSTQPATKLPKQRVAVQEEFKEISDEQRAKNLPLLAAMKTATQAAGKSAH